MSWECPCGVSNRDSRTKCKACGTPKGMVWTPIGFKPPEEAHRLEKARQEKAPQEVWSVSDVIRQVFIWGGIIAGICGGIYLASFRIRAGREATIALVNYYFYLPWNYLPPWHSTEGLIGLGIVVLFLFFALMGRLEDLPNWVREPLSTVFEGIFLGIFLGLLMGAVTFFFLVFVHEASRFLRGRGVF